MVSVKKSILLLEKENGLRRTLSLILKRAGYQVLSPLNGSEAMDMIAEGRRCGDRIVLLIVGALDDAMHRAELLRALTDLAIDVPELVLPNGPNGHRESFLSDPRRKSKTASMRIPYTGEEFIKCVENLTALSSR